MQGYIYILWSSKTNKYYVGSSTDPIRRLNTQHNLGMVRSTKSGIPWSIVFKQRYESLEIARKIEYKIKNFKSRVIIEKILNDNYCRLVG